MKHCKIESYETGFLKLMECDANCGIMMKSKYHILHHNYILPILFVCTWIFLIICIINMNWLFWKNCSSSPIASYNFVVLFKSKIVLFLFAVWPHQYLVQNHPDCCIHHIHNYRSCKTLHWIYWQPNGEGLYDFTIYFIFSDNS